MCEHFTFQQMALYSTSYCALHLLKIPFCQPDLENMLSVTQKNLWIICKNRKHSDHVKEE